jgi:hypothetical protein
LKELAECINDLFAAMKWRCVKTSQIWHNDKQMLHVIWQYNKFQDRYSAVSRIGVHGWRGEVARDVIFRTCGKDAFQDDLEAIRYPNGIQDVRILYWM